MSDLRTAAQKVVDAWSDPLGMKRLCEAMEALRAALEKTEPRRAAVACKHRNEPRGCYRVRCRPARLGQHWRPALPAPRGHRGGRQLQPSGV